MKSNWKKAYEELSVSYKKLNDLKNEYQQSCDSLKRNKSQLSTQLIETNTDLENLQQKYSTLQKSYADIQEKFSNTETELFQAENDRDRWKSVYDTLRTLLYATKFGKSDFTIKNNGHKLEE